VNAAISVDRVSKAYTKYVDTPTLAYSVLSVFGRSYRSRLWALRDVSLEVPPGQAIGIIGRNGSGKSTLLQMLCGVTSPTSGEVRVRGRIAPLISVGVGFHPELTGRENVYVNASIMGLRKPEIDARLDEIVAFSEIESFIDTPVKFYSSGMFVRLGFSVAAHVRPDVLLVDEVLAVGDLGFQIKCFQHMRALLDGGTTIVVVSHNLNAVQTLCDRAVLLAGGQMIIDGSVDDALSAFHQQMDESPQDVLEPQAPNELPVDRVQIEAFRLRDGAGRTISHFDCGGVLEVELDVLALDDVEHPFLSYAVTTTDGVTVSHETNMFDPYPALGRGERRRLSARLHLNLASGSYVVQAAVGQSTPGAADRLRMADSAAAVSARVRSSFQMTGRAGVSGIADLEADFLERTADETDPDQPALRT
jgi:ABC-type polysaccharide/polyol phosphate transport system ATPase subunit